MPQQNCFRPLPAKDNYQTTLPHPTLFHLLYLHFFSPSFPFFLHSPSFFFPFLPSLHSQTVRYFFFVFIVKMESQFHFYFILLLLSGIKILLCSALCNIMESLCCCVTRLLYMGCAIISWHYIVLVHLSRL